jgi:hypothetical protein
MVVWEHADMCTAQELPGDAFPTAVVVLQATISEHTVRWYPFGMRLGPVTETGMPAVVPQWETPVQDPGGWLPEPVTRLLAAWRDWSEGDDIEAQAAVLEQAGYRVRFRAA